MTGTPCLATLEGLRGMASGHRGGSCCSTSYDPRALDSDSEPAVRVRRHSHGDRDWQPGPGPAAGHRGADDHRVRAASESPEGSQVRVTGTGSGAGRGESRTPGGAVTPAVAAGPSDRACSPTDLKHYSTVIRTPPRRAAGGRGVLSDRRPGRYARRPAAGRGPGTLSGVTVASEALA